MAEPMTNARLDEIEKLANAATPGPWNTDPDGCLGPNTIVAEHGGYEHMIGTFDAGTGNDADADRAFVLAAREAVPELVAEARRLRTIVDAAAHHHRRVPLYESADACPHPEPSEDGPRGGAWDDWVDEHPWGDHEDVGRVCLSSPVAAQCPSCRDSEYSDPVSWPCPTAVALGLDAQLAAKEA